MYCRSILDDVQDRYPQAPYLLGWQGVGLPYHGRGTLDTTPPLLTVGNMTYSSEKRPIRVLGISSDYHDSAAALVVDGVVVGAVQEERLSRRKGDPSFPALSIDWLLRDADLHPDELDAVVFYENPFEKVDRILTSQNLGRPRALRTFINASMTWLPEKLWVNRRVRDLLGRKVPLYFCDHHLSHAASAFLPSPFERAAILTVDGVGEWSTTTIGLGQGSEVSLVEQIEFPNSLGLLYSAFTLYCGFRINSGEYKLMGLAPYGQPIYRDLILERMVHLAEDGSFTLNPSYFSYLDGMHTYNEAFEYLLGKPTRQPDSPLTRFHADVAASIQSVLNTAVLGLARRAVETTGCRDLVLAGGVALNVVSIGALERSGVVDHVWVQPAAGDAGGALGAAMWGSHHLFGLPRPNLQPDAMSGAFLGPSPDYAETVPSVLDAYGLDYETLSDEDMSSLIAKSVSDGLVVAVARGPMEFGPRALGGRSVLADARDPATQRRLNLKTKFREGFRPFAPVVLAERADDYFVMDDHDSPYMLKTYPVRPELRLPTAGLEDQDFAATVSQVRSTIPAVTHMDYSARVQTVDADRNPFLHSVLAAFDQLTGCPVMVNTSFNVRGEPIVCDTTDALECFLSTDIDVLVVGSQVVRKEGQTTDALKPRRSAAYALD
jgi:carbamoyltransferase